MLLARCLLLLAAAAQATAPSPADVFEISVRGTPYGVEECRRVTGPEGTSLTGKTSLKIPGLGDAALSQTAKLDPAGHPLAYDLDADVPGQESVLRVAPNEKGYLMSVTARGATEPARTQQVDSKESVFLLDNNFASHLDVLTRTLGDLEIGKERSIVALVPQVLIAIGADIRRGPDGTGKLDGAKIATRTYKLVLANVLTELTARADDGALLQADVPAQGALLRRRGFETTSEPPASTLPAAAPLASDARETATTVKGSAAELPAVLLVPASEAKVPAAVLLSGSGPNDRDETIGPNKPFADIARGLGDRGIASVRFDKRTLAIKDKTKLYGTLLKEEYYDDAAAALATLAANPKIDPKRIFVIGHSEGAMVAPVVASKSPGVAGIVMMAAAARPIDEVLIDQVAFGAKLTGRSDAEIAEQTASLKQTFAVIRDAGKKDTPPFMGASAAYWRDFIALDVPKLVQDSKLPVLVLQGDKDIQVRKDADFDRLKSKVGDGGGRVTYRSFPDLNHLFMKVEHESTGVEYGMPAHVEPAVVSAIADWILAH